MITELKDVVDCVFTKKTCETTGYLTHCAKGEEVTIPCDNDYDEQGDIDAHMQTIIAAGCDRNIVVYDTESDSMSDRLTALLCVIMSRNRSEMSTVLKMRLRPTIILVDKKHEAFKPKLNNPHIVFCDLQRYESFYIDQMCAAHAPKKKEMVIALDAPHQSFLSIDSTYGRGVGVINGDRVLLGSI
jgi:hypothetical protein